LISPEYQLGESGVITTALTGGVVSSHFDSHLVETLVLSVVRIYELRKQNFLIAIRNQYGEIYRLIGVDSPVELFEILKKLGAIGLFRELPEAPPSETGYQAILIYNGTTRRMSKSRYIVPKRLRAFSFQVLETGRSIDNF
jgi:hypothetical protein